MKKTNPNLICLVVLFSFFFIQCTTNEKTDPKNNQNLILQNINEYSEKFLSASIDIEREFLKNKFIERNSKLKNELLLCKNEEQIRAILAKAGVSNGEEVIALIKKSIVIQNEFRKQNPDFYLMEIKERTKLLETQFNVVLENYLALNLNNNITNRSCAGTYNLDISRCNRSYGKCAVFAVIAAADGIIPGIIGGIYCAWDLSDCKNEALEDYEDCIN